MEEQYGSSDLRIKLRVGILAPIKQNFIIVLGGNTKFVIGFLDTSIFEVFLREFRDAVPQSDYF